MPPTGRTADLPIFCVCETRGGLLASERFFFDMNDLCRQLGVAIDDVERALQLLRPMPVRAAENAHV